MPSWPGTDQAASIAPMKFYRYWGSLHKIGHSATGIGTGSVSRHAKIIAKNIQAN